MILEVTRASNVEYGITPGVRGWEVQLSDDPRLGSRHGLMVIDEHTAIPKSLVQVWAKLGRYNGFKTRAEALAVEVRWLNQNVLTLKG
jgi:hypothetical protein